MSMILNTILYKYAFLTDDADIIWLPFQAELRPAEWVQYSIVI